MTQSFVTMILAGGKGTRMGSSDKHKVCFEVLGKPVIIRALETYNLCGSTLNVVVVGMLAESVMQTINTKIPGVAYAFQEKPMGTGDAARKGAEILERSKYRGDVLVVAGDKVIEPHVIKKLVETHQKNGADLTLATAKRPLNSSTGIILKNSKGRITGILEESERRRLVFLESVYRHLQKSPVISHAEAKKLAQAILSEKQIAALLRELWPIGDHDNSISSEVYRQRIPGMENQGILDIGNLQVTAGDILEKYDQMNLSTYVYRAPVLYESLHKLQTSRPHQELYLTDTLKIIAEKQDHAKIFGFEITNTKDLMAFNNPQELLLIEETFRQKENTTVHLVEPEEADGAVFDHVEALVGETLVEDLLAELP